MFHSLFVWLLVCAFALTDSGGTVRISADTVAKSGVITGTTALNVSSRGDITGSGAFMGGNIALAADVDRTGGGPGAKAGGFMDVARGNAAITASGTLTLNAGGGLTLAGLNVTSGGNADIQAHGGITIASLALQFDRGDHKNTWQKQRKHPAKATGNRRQAG